MAKKQKSKKKVETKTITKKDIDKLLEDNNIVVDEPKEVKSEEKKEKLKRTKRNAALYEKEVNGTIHKDYAFNYSKENRITEEAFLTSILKRIRNNEGKLSDDELDRIVYGNQFRVAS